MRRLFIVLFLLTLLFSCDKSDIPKCDFADATQDLVWLKEIIDDREANPTEEMQYCYILQATLKRREVFVFGDCNPAINKSVLVFDCEGEPIQNSEGDTIGANELDLKNNRLIWQPDDFACTFNANVDN